MGGPDAPDAYAPEVAARLYPGGFQAAAGRWSAAFEVFNLANVRWNDIEYCYVSRLKDQVAPAADYVVHPGVPRTVRARIQMVF